MTTSQITTSVPQLKINRLTETQLQQASGLSNTQLYAVDPEYAGGKLLQSDINGDIVESATVPSTIQVLAATDTITLEGGKLYQGGEQTSLTVTPPSSATVGFITQITFKSGTTPTAFTDSSNSIIWNTRGDDIVSGSFVPAANKNYTVIIHYNGFNFIGITEGITI